MHGESIFRGLRIACPRCSEGRLHWKNWRHWKHVSQDGREHCDHLVYYECDRCHSKIKILRGGLVRDVDEREWAQYCMSEEPDVQKLNSGF